MVTTKVWSKEIDGRRSGYSLGKDAPALLHAVADNDHERIQKCLKGAWFTKAADVNMQDKRGWTALHIAAFMDAGDTASILLAHGANINAKDERGTTPLHKMMREIPENHTRQRILLLYGADVNAKNKEGQTPEQCSGDSERLFPAAP